MHPKSSAPLQVSPPGGSGRCRGRAQSHLQQFLLQAAEQTESGGRERRGVSPVRSHECSYQGLNAKRCPQFPFLIETFSPSVVCFFNSLDQLKNVSSCPSACLLYFFSDRHTRHQRVKTWTRHVDIFTKDFLFVPVNQE